MSVVNIEYQNNELVISYSADFAKKLDFFNRATYAGNNQYQHIYKVTLSSNKQNLIDVLVVLTSAKDFSEYKNAILTDTYVGLCYAATENINVQNKKTITNNADAIERHFGIKQLMKEADLEFDEAIGTYSVHRHSRIDPPTKPAAPIDIDYSKYESKRPKTLGYGTSPAGFGTPPAVLNALHTMKQQSQKDSNSTYSSSYPNSSLTSQNETVSTKPTTPLLYQPPVAPKTNVKPTTTSVAREQEPPRRSCCSIL